MMKARLKYMFKHWKIGVHFIFRTKRFGVNNKWWSKFDSIFGASFWQRLRIINNWKMMKFRAGKLHFLGDESYRLLFERNK